MAFTISETAAPGAYQALVPNNPVNVAPPTLVSAATCSNLSSDKNSETFTLLRAANLVKGIIPVSL